MWVSLAVTQGQENAVTARDKIAKKMNQEQIAEAQQLVHEWKPKTLQLSEYTLDLKKNNTLVHLQGGLGLGISDEVTELLATHLDVEGIILDSQGGWINEGQRLADLISSYGLDSGPEFAKNVKLPRVELKKTWKLSVTRVQNPKPHANPPQASKLRPARTETGPAGIKLPKSAATQPATNWSVPGSLPSPPERPELRPVADDLATSHREHGRSP